MDTLIILNPNSHKGLAGRIFHDIEPKLFKVLGDFVVTITHDPHAVARHLRLAAPLGLKRVIALGGDGTNYSVINCLMQKPELGLQFGTVPMGTGRDFARSLGLLVDPHLADRWLPHAKAVRCDIGRVEYLDVKRGGRPMERLFLNVCSTGISRDVASRVNKSKGRAASYVTHSIISLLTHRPKEITVRCDGEVFYEGPSYMLAVANGRYFGRGMKIAPKALLNDALFDVVVVGGMSRARALAMFPKLYDGSHVGLPQVHSGRARTVEIASKEGPIELDLDGEEALGENVRFTIIPRAIRILSNPSEAAAAFERDHFDDEKSLRHEIDDFI